MKTRIFIASVIAVALCVFSSERPHLAAQGVQELKIGSAAPELAIEHWIQDGNGFFKPVTKFEKGKVYVVEFWATWCGPCIQSMPHLAELQNKYRGQNVQIISVSNETVEEVKDLLGKQNEQVGKSFGELTSAWCLTTDPDGSVYKDYMDAAKQGGIPTAFLVGKTSEIEWIGHPMDMDGPLDSVVNDSWDRATFQKEMELQKQLQENMQRVSMLAGAGKFEEAVKLAQDQRKATEGTAMEAQWTSVQYQIKLMGGMIDDDVLSHFRGRLTEMKGDAYAVGQFAYTLYGQIKQGADVGVLSQETLAALQSEVSGAEAEMLPLLYNTMALLKSETGDLEGAVAAQQAAVDAAPDERVKNRLSTLLEDLKSRLDASDQKSE
ncbi:TlpA family protein disulfide reductase [Rubripirellula sp.]|nr:TlpA family protein disulfide reductase [Rubripirellula sp.]